MQRSGLPVTRAADRVNNNETAGLRDWAWPWSFWFGGLIQTAMGFGGGLGGLLTKPFELALKA